MNRIKLGIVGILLLVVALTLRGCLTKPPLPPDISQPLPEDTAVLVHQHKDILTVKTPTNTVRRYVPQDGSVAVSVKKDGGIKINVKTKGWTAKPTIGLLVSDKVYGTVGLRVAYWNRFGLLVGGGWNGRGIGWLGASYSLDQLSLRNTDIYVGYTTRKQLAVGISVRL